MVEVKISMRQTLMIWALFGATGLAQSPGEIVGTTLYDMQEMTSGTNRIAVASDGGIHVCWTKALSFPGVRYIYYNYRPPNDSWIGEVPLSDVNRSGFGNISLGPDDCVAIFYHDADQMEIHVNTSCGGYNDYILPDTNSLWPKGSVTVSGRFNVFSGRTNDPAQEITIMYNTSEDFGHNWPPWERVDSAMTLLWAINSSRISGRAAIVEGIPVNRDEHHYFNMNIGYIISDDGVNWDFSSWDMITDYGSMSDRAVVDADLIFDNDNYLHVIWNTVNIDSLEYNISTLWHWSEVTGVISEVAHFGPTTCSPGTWNLALCKMSIGIDQNDNLFCVWTGFSSADAAANGFCNGDLYMSYSMNGGLIWELAENITNSQTPDCPSGECDSDNWATLAEKVDDYLRIFYVNDKDAGSAVLYEGVPTVNDMKYLEIPNPTSTPVSESKIPPENIILFSNYPNPFNSLTRINFSLIESAKARIEIFDIAGRLVVNIADREFSAGENSIIWEAKDYPSGVYFARLSSPVGNIASKLVLLK